MYELNWYWAKTSQILGQSAHRKLDLKRWWLVILLLGVIATAGQVAQKEPASAAIVNTLAPNATQDTDWPQLGHDAQRTNYTSLQVDPPYCYTWKWYQVPLASHAQPIVVAGRLFIGSMDGSMYARNASTGAPLWSFATGGPIRHSAGVISETVVFSSHDGYTYALAAAKGTLKWKTLTGESVTAPLLDTQRGRIYVASSNGILSALDLADGAQVWQYDSGAPILTSPSLSVDGRYVFFGNEDIQAIAVHATDGSLKWHTTLQGQSLADRYPVVTTSTVMYRSQPLYFFHLLLHEGDDIMDQAGLPVNPDWATDWSNVKPRILSYLSAQPSKQTFFVLNAASGALAGSVPVLYTYGGNNAPNVPVIRGNDIYATYRARHGIQTDSGTIHVTSKYDAELGQLNLSTLDMAGLHSSTPVSGQPEFRMTSDEPSMLSMGGNILYVDNTERLGGLNVATGQLVYAGNLSNANGPDFDSPGGANPFFPLSGNTADPGYPFPSPLVTDGYERAGAVVANNMLYWHALAAGLTGMSHKSSATCPPPQVWTAAASNSPSQATLDPQPVTINAVRALTDYVTLDLTTPVANPPADLVARLRDEIRAITSANGHLMPYYLERGFSTPSVWPYDTANPPGPPAITYQAHGNAYWHDPGELLYTAALAYPYLDATLQATLKQYMAAEMGRYPPLQNLPWGNTAGQPTWLKQGVPRERYAVPFRDDLNSWPPPAASLSAIYSVWLWSKNTGDWSYAQLHWAETTALFNSRSANMTDYYSDIAGAIGYARLAAHFENTSAYNNGVRAAVNAMQAGKNITTYIDYANHQYLDPRDLPTGWSAPVFYGMTPEVGLYLREQTNGLARTYLISLEGNDGLRWWYLTRVGEHAEVGETSFIAPSTAWSHFLAHAYVVGDSQERLVQWLDRSWGRGDLYSIQKIVATLHAPQAEPDLSTSFKAAGALAPRTGQAVTYTISIRNTGSTLAHTVYATDIVPNGLSFVPGSLTATLGSPDASQAPTLKWSGVPSSTPIVTITFQASVTESSSHLIINTVLIEAEAAGSLTRSASIMANGESVYLPLVLRNAGQ